MYDLAQAIPFTYAALFPVLNPLAGAMIFLNFTHGLPESTTNTMAKKIGVSTFVLLVIVLLTGSWILRFFGITIPIVEIGGGLVVASIAWKLLNQPVSVTNVDAQLASVNKDEKSITEMTFFPLTMPITAGPGCIAITLTIGAHEMHDALTRSIMGEIGAILGILLASITVWVCYRYADDLSRKLGQSGTRVIMRLSAFINMCIGLQIIWNGIQALLH